MDKKHIADRASWFPICGFRTQTGMNHDVTEIIRTVTCTDCLDLTIQAGNEAKNAKNSLQCEGSS